MKGDPVSVAIALGSNLGDREGALRRAVAELAAVISHLRVSSSHETTFVGLGSQPLFLNAAAPVATACGDAPTLHEAATLGCEARLRELFQASPAALESRNTQGQTALAAAVLKRRIDAVRALLSMGADANAPIRFSAGARPNASGLERAQRPELAEGSTPLILAQDAAGAALLLRFGADARIKNSYGWSALFAFGAVGLSTSNGPTVVISVTAAFAVIALIVSNLPRLLARRST